MTGAKSGNGAAMSMVNPGAAAIDIGSTMHMVAINPNADDNPVREFRTFTGNLHDMAHWFKESGVTSVAMESTGVYWIPAYEVLEERGFHVILVNARYAKNVPGRKTDVSDAAWLQRLHSYGLLRGSFRPEAGVATLRAYLRQRERLIEYTASHNPAHAKNADGDERATPSCHHGHYRYDGHADYQAHCGGWSVRQAPLRKCATFGVMRPPRRFAPPCRGTGGRNTSSRFANLWRCTIFIKPRSSNVTGSWKRHSRHLRPAMGMIPANFPKFGPRSGR